MKDWKENCSCVSDLRVRKIEKSEKKDFYFSFYFLSFLFLFSVLLHAHGFTCLSEREKEMKELPFTIFSDILFDSLNNSLMNDFMNSLSFREL
jgi:hypothetical protein